jgi:hypothetical protein
VRDAPQQRGGDPRRAGGFPTNGVLDALDELVHAGVAPNEAQDPRLGQSDDALFVVGNADRDDWPVRAGGERRYGLSGREVEDDHVGVPGLARGVLEPADGRAQVLGVAPEHRCQALGVEPNIRYEQDVDDAARWQMKRWSPGCLQGRPRRCPLPRARAVIPASVDPCQRIQSAPGI